MSLLSVVGPWFLSLNGKCKLVFPFTRMDNFSRLFAVFQSFTHKSVNLKRPFHSCIVNICQWSEAVIAVTGESSGPGVPWQLQRFGDVSSGCLPPHPHLPPCTRRASRGLTARAPLSCLCAPRSLPRGMGGEMASGHDRKEAGRGWGQHACARLAGAETWIDRPELPSSFQLVIAALPGLARGRQQHGAMRGRAARHQAPLPPRPEAARGTPLRAGAPLEPGAPPGWAA